MDMLEVHDWPEAIHGDELILELDPNYRRALKQAKFENERKALAKICQDLPNGDKIMTLWLRFENSDDPAAEFGRQLDKYQAVEKALEYEQSQGIPLFEEFLSYSINFIHHPVLLQRIEQLKSKWAGLTHCV
jgi:5'-deoxynucleotidase YfbR-like HD superfamily hydrolase